MNVRAWRGAVPAMRRYCETREPERLGARQPIRSMKWTTTRPALTINGITGGYQGPGGKGVIPARALAKVSFRLVPDQDPREIERLFREHIARVVSLTVQAAIRTHMMAQPALLSRRHPALRAAAVAYRKGFGAAPVFVRSGGTIPVINMIRDVLNLPTALMGFALPDDQIHGPNEKFHLPNFYNGIVTCIWFLHTISAMGTPGADNTRPSVNTDERCAMIVDRHCHAGKGDGLTGPWNTNAAD